MKWVDVKDAKKDGSYLTYSHSGNLGLLVMSRFRWYGRQGGEIIQIPNESMGSISQVLRIVLPKGAIK